MKKLSDSRVLLVDDAKANLDILVEGLKGDYKLSLALNGEMALQVAQRTPPDLVLLDIQMPGLDGYEVCRRMRTMPETADVPIVFLSSLEEVQDKARGFEAGANDYVTKPFELLEVKARVRSHLKAKAYNDAVKEQIAGDLRVAREIQTGVLPHDIAATGERYGVELAALLEPAREIGGDLYGVFAPTDERLVLFMGDVSGKGIPASLFMMRTATLLQLLVKEVAEPERILERLNDELAADNPGLMFVTLVCVVYEPKRGLVSIANGGHNRPVLLRPGEPARFATESMGTALGFDTGLAYQRTELELRDGDALVLYTDGVTEAFDTADRLYGNDALLRDAGELSGKNAAVVTEQLFGKVRDHAAGARQSDDIAILALRAGLAAAQHASATHELRATPEDVMHGVELLKSFGRAQDVPERELFGLSLALEECATNLVRHSFASDAAQRFRVVLQHDGAHFTIELRDRGLHFDPTLVEPDGAKEMHEGGVGLLLVKHYIDDMQYGTEGDEHVLRLIKHLR